VGSALEEVPTAEGRDDDLSDEYVVFQGMPDFVFPFLEEGLIIHANGGISTTSHGVTLIEMHGAWILGVPDGDQCNRCYVGLARHAFADKTIWEVR
jgi:hypothetical protein